MHFLIKRKKLFRRPDTFSSSNRYATLQSHADQFHESVEQISDNKCCLSEFLSSNVLLEVLALLFDKVDINYVVKNNESADWRITKRDNEICKLFKSKTENRKRIEILHGCESLKTYDSHFYAAYLLRNDSDFEDTGYIRWQSTTARMRHRFERALRSSASHC